MKIQKPNNQQKHIVAPKKSENTGFLDSVHLGGMGGRALLGAGLAVIPIVGGMTTVSFAERGLI